jgi:hypothetical protein
LRGQPRFGMLETSREYALERGHLAKKLARVHLAQSRCSQPDSGMPNDLNASAQDEVEVRVPLVLRHNRGAGRVIVHLDPTSEWAQIEIVQPTQ